MKHVAAGALLLFPALGLGALSGRLPLPVFVPAAALTAIAFAVALLRLHGEAPSRLAIAAAAIRRRPVRRRVAHRRRPPSSASWHTRTRAA